jgi:hypothetical protein
MFLGLFPPQYLTSPGHQKPGRQSRHVFQPVNQFSEAQYWPAEQTAAFVVGRLDRKKRRRRMARGHIFWKCGRG